jgi:hypothetical protein
MDLTRMQARIEPRPPWQAMDLGARMARTWWRPLLATWLLFTLVPFLLILALFGLESIYSATLLFWWLKPLWDKPLLEFSARALFDERPTPWQLVRSFPQYGFKGLFSSLTWRRLSPSRSFNLPVMQLEGSRGEDLANRLRVLHRPPSSRSGSLTLLMLHVEQGLTLGMVLLLYMLAPWQFNLELSDWLMGREATHQLILAASWYLALCITEPLYVTCGFALYLNRRTWLEAWDLDLGLRRIGERRGGKAGLAMLILCMLPLLPGLNEARADSEPTARDQATEVVAGEDFMPMEMKQDWRQREWLRSQQWLQDLIDWWQTEGEPERAPDTQADDLLWLADAVRILMWVLAVSLVLWLVWHYRDWLREVLPGPARPRPATEVAGLDIRPESLPDDIPTAVRRALADGNQRAALGLLYRATLSNLVQRRHLPLHRGTTEQECLQLLREQLHDQQALQLMEQLTPLWIETAWAHRPADRSQVEACLEQWQRTFRAREATHAYA